MFSISFNKLFLFKLDDDVVFLSLTSMSSSLMFVWLSSADTEYSNHVQWLSRTKHHVISADSRCLIEPFSEGRWFPVRPPVRRTALLSCDDIVTSLTGFNRSEVSEIDWRFIFLMFMWFCGDETSSSFILMHHVTFWTLQKWPEVTCAIPDL